MVFGRIKGTAQRVREGFAKAESKFDTALENRAVAAKASRAKWDRRKELVSEIRGPQKKAKAPKSARSGRGGLTSSESPFKVGGSGGSPWKIGSSGSGFPSAAASNPWNLQSSSSPFTSGGKEPAKKKRTIRVTIDD